MKKQLMLKILAGFPQYFLSELGLSPKIRAQLEAVRRTSNDYKGVSYAAFNFILSVDPGLTDADRILMYNICIAASKAFYWKAPVDKTTLDINNILLDDSAATRITTGLGDLGDEVSGKTYTKTGSIEEELFRLEAYVSNYSSEVALRKDLLPTITDLSGEEETLVTKSALSKISDALGLGGGEEEGN